MRAFTSIFAAACLTPILLFAQDFESLYSQGRYEEALAVVKGNIKEIYAGRFEDKSVPREIVSVMSDKEEVSLKLLFRQRKAKGFFIEDNPTLSDLHVKAGDCCRALDLYREAISSYTQALRYKMPEASDHEIYYSMARTYEKSGDFEGRIRALEAAFSFAPENYQYSLEIGTALAPSARKKKAIYHLKRYLDNAEGDIDVKLYLLAGGLNEDLGYYLETVSWYRKYLQARPDDGSIQYALGCIALSRTGNHKLAVSSLEKALELLPDSDIYRRSKAYEFIGDIALSDVQYGKAISAYGRAMEYQNIVKDDIEARKAGLADMSDKINTLKIELMKNRTYAVFREYEALEEQKGKAAAELSRVSRQYGSLNCGAVRWNTAWCLERLEELEQAIELYEEAISFDYKTNEAREKIVKLRLKIKRGY